MGSLGRMAEEAPTLETETVRELCGDYAAFTRTNLSEEHGQIVTQLAAIEEQISTFSEMMTDIQRNNYILKDILPKITTQFESLKPSFTKIDRMEDLICIVNADFDVLDRRSREHNCG